MEAPPPGDPANRMVELIQPASIRAAVRLMWVGAAFSFFNVVHTLTRIDAIKADIRARMHNGDHAFSQSAFQLMSAMALFVLVVGGLGIVAAWLWLAWKNSQGRSWVRIVISVFGLIGVVQTPILLLAGKESGYSATIDILETILFVAILSLLWRKESSAFYAASAAKRARHLTASDGRVGRTMPGDSDDHD